jgi:hypothetical protein
MKRRLVFASFCSLSLPLSGCMVGPKYVQPTVATAPAFKEQPPESFKESESPQEVDGRKPAQPDDEALRGKWWEIFGDPQLNALEEPLPSRMWPRRKRSWMERGSRTPMLR